jgi:hypothetical protein
MVTCVPASDVRSPDAAATPAPMNCRRYVPLLGTVPQVSPAASVICNSPLQVAVDPG